MRFAPGLTPRTAVCALAFLLAPSPRPAIAQGILGDVNGDARQSVSDVFYLINFLFAGGPAPIPSEISVVLPG